MAISLIEPMAPSPTFAAKRLAVLPTPPGCHSWQEELKMLGRDYWGASATFRIPMLILHGFCQWVDFRNSKISLKFICGPTRSTSTLDIFPSLDPKASSGSASPQKYAIDGTSSSQIKSCVLVHGVAGANTP